MLNYTINYITFAYMDESFKCRVINDNTWIVEYKEIAVFVIIKNDFFYIKDINNEIIKCTFYWYEIEDWFFRLTLDYVNKYYYSKQIKGTSYYV